MAGVRSEPAAYWQFYCYRCEQWCERRGAWCQLYESEPRTSLCVFREYPNRANGVPWWPYKDVEDEDVRWGQAGERTCLRDPTDHAS